MGRKIRRSLRRRLSVKSDKVTTSRKSLLEILERRAMLAADPLISEFQASNQGTIVDGDGETSDWIELRNPSTEALDISGYYLTDDKADLRQWQVPDETVLAPGEHRIVFASGDDKVDGAGYLHTSFRLSSGGEYLGLVKPDGVTIVQEYDEYPAQLTDQSFGIASDRDTVQLVTSDSSVRSFVPTDGSLGLDWTQTAFNDDGWTEGSLSVGYEVLQEGVTVTDEFDAIGPEWTTDIPEGSPGTITADGGDLVISAPEGTNYTYGARGSAPLIYRSLPSTDAPDFEVTANFTKRGTDRGAAGIAILDLSTGKPVVQFEYDQDRYFRIFAGGQEQDDDRDSGEDVYSLRLVRDGLAGTWTGYMLKPAAKGEWELIGTAVDGENGTPEITGEIGVGLYASTANGTMEARVSSIDIVVPDQRPVYGPMINADVLAMKDVNSSVYLRMPFNLEGDPSRFDEMSMSLRYDDGMVAYLNGERISERNVPAEVTWNSSATGAFGAVNGRIPRQKELLGSHIGALKEGENVLAVHGVNVDAADKDFFFDAQLVASEILGESVQYFTNPTPGEANQLPAAPVPTIVGEDGVFFGEKTVELSAPAGFEIRYSLDGSEVTADSTLYTGPFTLNTSARLEAVSFDVSPDPAYVPSNVANGTFFALTEDLRGRTSDLPIMIIDSLGQSLQGTGSVSLTPMNVIIFDVDKATGRSAIEEGKIDYLGRGGARDRGSSSSNLPKPNMAFEMWGPSGTDLDDDADVSVLGMAPDSDYVFYAATSYDPVQIHNQYAFELSNQIGQWAPDYRHIELFSNMRWQRNRNELNTVGPEDYFGVYAVMEKISRGSHRVDVASIDPSVTKTPEEAAPGEPNISGGYIWKVDRGDPGEAAFSAGGGSFNWVYPKSPKSNRARPDQKATAAQEAWVRDYFSDIQRTTRDPDFNDPEGYRKYIDLDSWVEHHFINVLTFNVDAYRLSGYLHKDRDGKLAYGPVWDFDRALNSTDGRDKDPFVWRSETGDRGTNFFGSGGGMQWLAPLFQKDINWWQHYIDSWDVLRKDEFSDENLHGLVDTLADEIRESQAREREDCSHCSSIRPRGGWEKELRDLKGWLSDRSGFFDSNFAPPAFIRDAEGSAYDRRDDGAYVNAGAEIDIVPIASVNNDTALISGVNGATDASYMVPVNNDLADTWTALDFDDAAWSTGKLGIGFGTSTGFDENYTTVVRPSLVNEDATNVLIRVPFTVDDLDSLDQLVLKMKYDDGFVVHLNGEKLFENNLRSAEYGWDSRASNRRNTDAVQFEEFDLSEHTDKLQVGENVLAIRAINSSRTSGDLLMLPELVSRVVTYEPLTFGKVYYTTDGSDPRGPDGNPTASATELERGQKLTINENTRVIARNFDESDRGSESRIVLTDWSAPTELNFVVEEANLVISEVNYNPADATEAEAAAGYGNDDFEFLEIHNRGGAAADLVGLRLTDGIEFDFLDVAPIQPGGHGVVVRNADAFQMRYGENAAVIGVYEGSLSNAGEDIDLVDGAGNILFSVNYSDSDPWPVRADGFGATLELANVNGVNDATQNKWYSWQASSENGGSPGQAGSGPAGVVINEVVANTNGDLEDSIELHNVTEAAIDISGWLLSDSAGDRDKFSIPAGTNLAAGGYIVFDEGDFNADTPVGNNESFALGRTGDSVWLTKADGSFVDDVHFGETKANTSLGRMPNGSGRLAPFSQTTFGAQNASPSVGPLVISEVNYNPRASEAALAADPTLETSDLEYIKLHNSSASEIDLTNWRVRGGTDYNFDDGVKIGAGESLILLKFNPDNPENINQVNAFKAHYGLDESARLVGGYAGLLNNSDDRITLLRPDTPAEDTPNEIPHVIEDEVLYDDLAPWPTEADGTGRALSRVSLTAFGNVASSWVAGALPESLASELSGDFNGDGTLDAGDINLLFAEIRNGTNDAAYDLNDDSLVNAADRDVLVKTLIGADYGDANLDGVFDSNDLVTIFIAGEFEDGVALNSGWETGDWDGDGDFGSGDLVIAFQDGGYAAAGPLGARLDMARIGGALAEGPEAQFTDGLLTTASTTSQPLSSQVEVELIDEMVESLFDNDQLEDDKGSAIDDVAGALVDDGMSI